MKQEDAASQRADIADPDPFGGEDDAPPVPSGEDNISLPDYKHYQDIMTDEEFRLLGYSDDMLSHEGEDVQEMASPWP